MSGKSCDEVPGELYGSYGTDLFESQWTSKHDFLSKSRKEDLLCAIWKIIIIGRQVDKKYIQLIGDTAFTSA